MLKNLGRMQPVLQHSTGYVRCIAGLSLNLNIVEIDEKREGSDTMSCDCLALDTMLHHGGYVTYSEAQAPVC